MTLCNIRRRTVMSAVLLFFSAASFVFAQEADADGTENIISLTIDEAVAYALEGNVTLKESTVSLNAAERSMNNSWNTFLPSLSASAGMSQNLASGSLPNFSLGASASVSVSGSTYTTMLTNKLNYEYQQLSYEQTVRSVELKVRSAFYSLLAEKENLELQKNSMNTSWNQYNSNLAKYNRGTLSRLDVLSSQISAQNAQLSYENAQIAFESSLDSFKQVIGIPLSQKIKLEGSLNDFLSLSGYAPAADETSETKSSSVESLEKQLEIAENALLASKISAYSPSVSASYSYSLSGNTTTGLKAGNGSSTSFGSVSINARIPLDGLLPWSSSSQTIETRQDTIDNLELKIEEAKLNADVNLQNLMTQISKAMKTISLRQTSISLAQSSYSMTLDAYNHGTKDLLTLQNAYSNLLKAQASLASDEYSLATAILNLENAMGVPFGSILEKMKK